MGALFEIESQFEEVVRGILKQVESGLDTWKMTPKDWDSCLPVKKGEPHPPTEDYQRGYNDGIESVKGMLDMLLAEDFWTQD